MTWTKGFHPSERRAAGVEGVPATRPCQSPLSLVPMPPLPSWGSLAEGQKARSHFLTPRPRHPRLPHGPMGPPSLPLHGPQCLHLYNGCGYSTLPGGAAGETKWASVASRAWHPQDSQLRSCFLRTHGKPGGGEKQPRPLPSWWLGHRCCQLPPPSEKKQSTCRACGAHVFIRLPLGEVPGPVRSG